MPVERHELRAVVARRWLPSGAEAVARLGVLAEHALLSRNVGVLPEHAVDVVCLKGGAKRPDTGVAWCCVLPEHAAVARR